MEYDFVAPLTKCFALEDVLTTPTLKAHREKPVPESLFGESCMSQDSNLLNRGLQHMYFLTNFVKFL